MENCEESNLITPLITSLQPCDGGFWPSCLAVRHEKRRRRVALHVPSLRALLPPPPPGAWPLCEGGLGGWA